jgi:hypothetical protein
VPAPNQLQPTQTKLGGIPKPDQPGDMANDFRQEAVTSTLCFHPLIVAEKGLT